MIGPEDKNDRLWHARGWDDYHFGAKHPRVLKKSHPGPPYAIFVPPVPMWLMLADDGYLTSEPIVLLRARAVHIEAYQANGGWVGDWFLDVWEFMTARHFGYRSWEPIFYEEANYERWNQTWLGIATGQEAHDDEAWKAKAAARHASLTKEAEKKARAAEARAQKKAAKVAATA